MSVKLTDNIFEKIGKKHGVEIFRGALFNKIKRWYDCFSKYNIERALLIDGDDLSYDFDLAKRAMLNLKTSKVDMISHPDNIVTGLFTYAINKTAIKKLYDTVPNESTDTDVITRYIEQANLKTSYITLHDFEKNKDLRLTLDYKEDLEFFQKLYQNIGVLATGYEIINFLEKNKYLSEINYHKQKEYVKNQERFNAKIT